MATLGAFVAVIEDGQVLLTERADFRVWCLPGGMVEDGETIAEAAVREVQEETGLTVRLTRLVGIYSRPHWSNGGDHMTLFAAKPIGGILRIQETEVVDARYISPHNLPQKLLWWHRVCLQDALAEVGESVAKSFNVVWPFEPGVTRQQVYAMRDRGELPPDFIEMMCQQPPIDAQRTEVGSA